MTSGIGASVSAATAVGSSRAYNDPKRAADSYHPGMILMVRQVNHPAAPYPELGR